MALGYVAAATEKITVHFQDIGKNNGHSTFHVASGAADADIQAVVAAFEGLTNCLITAYTRETTTQVTGANPAVAISVNPLAGIQNELRVEFACGAGNSFTRTTIFGPLNTPLEQDSEGNNVLDLTNALAIALKNAGKAVMVNAGNQPATDLEYGRVYGRRRKG